MLLVKAITIESSSKYLEKSVVINAEEIQILDYRDEWIYQFEELKIKIADILEGKFVSIDHIGSTSVPGLGAKNRIDVQITVEKLTTEFKEFLDGKLKLAGFPVSNSSQDHRPPGDKSPDHDWEKLFITGICPDFDFRANIHVRELGKENQKYPILFRDYLRAHPSAASAYEVLKRELARYHKDDRIAYCEIKDPVCDLIMVSARDWAIQNGWELERALNSKRST